MLEFEFSSHGAGMIHAYRWEPEGQPRGVVQIIHGIAEYVPRYAGFAAFLNAHGLLVTGEDHMGHGKSHGTEPCHFSGGWCAAVDDSILIDVGDILQGSALSSYNILQEGGENSPMATALRYIGYDAFVLGNHEFNWGIPTMQSILGQASFPVLAANVTGAQGEPVTGAGWTIVERGGVKLAVIGVVTPDVPIWDSGKDGIDDAVYEAANVAVGKAIDEIGDQADVIMVSAHMGMYAEFDEEGGHHE